MNIEFLIVCSGMDEAIILPYIREEKNKTFYIFQYIHFKKDIGCFINVNMVYLVDY